MVFKCNRLLCTSKMLFDTANSITLNTFGNNYIQKSLKIFLELFYLFLDYGCRCVVFVELFDDKVNL